ncbi:MAG TPA: putative Ig domain-containing protein [Burkholderiales bacterium]|nr:putative Ig domain-containing protein [Burkholderiales bacterium]
MAQTSSAPFSVGIVNLPPVWTTVPTIAFVQGTPSTISIAAFASDPNGDALTITKNSAALPAGVTYDQANKRFVYDGVGGVGSTSGNVLTADDGKP